MSLSLRTSVPGSRYVLLSAFSVFALGAVSMQAATLCVKTHGNGGGCYSTISAAVAAANAGDTVQVEQGTYAEQVVITKSIALVGANQANTIIDATGKVNGIYINGLDNPGLSGVSVRGFTVENANTEGILAQNVSGATISGNTVRSNDRAEVTGAGCGTLRPFETNEADDCGEGLHLMGVDHSTVANNLVENNSGGILVSDETAPNHDNVITKNLVRDNPYDCGITMASHKAYVKTGTAPLAFGVYHNTVADNESRHNGFGSETGGAGVGLFAPGPGNVMINNSVVGNRLIENSMPGVAVHNHVNLAFPGHPPNPVVGDNAIVGNYISGNGADGSVGTTTPTGIAIGGPSPILGMVVSGNIVVDESVDVAFNSPSVLQLHLNNLSGPAVGVLNVNAAGGVNATENWWGCSKGPNANGCSSVSGTNVVWTPWLTTPIQAGGHTDGN